MSAEASVEKHIIWDSHKLDGYIFSSIYDIKINLLKESLEFLGYDFGKTDTDRINKIKYNNYLVPGIGPGVTSHISLGAALVALSSYFSNFNIPEDLIKYIQEEAEAGRVKETSLPNTEDQFEKGENIYLAFKDLGFSDEASFALTGACWVECGWDVHRINKAELNGSGIMKTSGYSGAGEGLFGLTYWSQKKKIIDALNPPGIPSDEFEYNKKHSRHLMDLDDDWWVRIAEYYIKNMAPNHFNVLNDEDDHIVLYASYLWKAAPSRTPDFDSVKKTVEKYIQQNEKMYLARNPSFRMHNGFCTQLCVSYLLSRFVNGDETPSLKDLGVNVDIEYKKSSFEDSSKGKGTKERERWSVLDFGLFKKNPKKWNIKKACEWIHNNSLNASSHSCAAYVRKAIEAGGLSTAGRPNWAWKYIDFLPKIGFRYISTVKKNSKDYKPEPGDIAVYQKNGDPNVPGHICMWSGKEWCSDFKQRNMIVYSGTSEAHIFRFED